MLSQAVSNQIFLDDLTLRMALIYEEQQERAGLLACVMGVLLFDKVQEQVARHWYATENSRRFLLALEESNFRDLLSRQKAEMAILRRRVKPNVVAAMIIKCLDDETQQRRRLQFVQESVFKDFFLKHHALFGDGQRPYHVDKQVKLLSGCPFVRRSDCPFHRADWVDTTSFEEQHVKCKHPQLRLPNALTRDGYANHVESKLRNTKAMTFRMYSVDKPSQQPNTAAP